MKKILGIILIILLIFICMGMVSADDVSLDDISSINDTIGENTSHNHSSVSELISDSPVKTSVINAPGGTFSQLQAIMDSSSDGDIVRFTGDYVYDSGFNKNGVQVYSNITIDLNGHMMDGQGIGRLMEFRGTDLTILNGLFYNGYSFGLSEYRGSAINSYGSYILIRNCTFDSNYGHSGALRSSTSYTWVDNCSFMNNRANSYAADMEMNSNTALIEHCIFYNRTGGSSSSIYLKSNKVSENYNAFLDGRRISSGTLYSLENNWFGNNDPNFGSIGQYPTYFVRLVNNVTKISSTKFNVSTKFMLYNRGNGQYYDIDNYLPNREIIYGYSGCTVTPASNVINNTTYAIVDVTSSYFTFNVTVDDEVFGFGTGRINITALNDTPMIGGIVTFRINATNDNSFDSYDTQVNLGVNPTLSYYGISSGSYNPSTGVIDIGTLSAHSSKIIDIQFFIPFNYSLVGKSFITTANLSSPYLFSTYGDSATITVINRTGGSYVFLQALIDNTPAGGTLVVPFNITYDPETDSSLRNGMEIDKDLILDLNGYTIDGIYTARIFWVTGSNVTLLNGVYEHGNSYPFSESRGGAISSYGSYILIANSIFRDCIGHSGAIRSSTSYTVIDGCVFENNSGDSGCGIDMEMNGNEVLVQHCTFNAPASPNGGSIYMKTKRVNVTNCVIVNNIPLFVGGGSKYSPEDNWWGSNDPYWPTYDVYPDSYVIMNFSNIQPITYSAGSSTLLVSLDTVFNLSDNTAYPLNGYIPMRNVTYTWNLGTVSPSTSTFSGNTTTTFSYPANMNYWYVNATIDDQTLSIGTSDIGIYIVPNKNPVDDGDTISFTVTVVNNGIMNAYDINVSLFRPSIPYGIVNITVENTTGTYDNLTHNWYIDYLEVGDSVSLIVNWTLADPGPILIFNATIENNTSIYDYNLTNNTDTCIVNVSQFSDLEIFKNISNFYPQTKENITYTIIVFNHGPSTATNVTVFDNLSSNLIFINSVSTKGNYNHTSGIWFMDNMTPYSNETLNITVFINKSGFVNNIVNVTSLINDTNKSNNVANVSFRTPPLSDIWVKITMDTQTSNYITYHIQAGNNGIEDANGTVVVFNHSSLYIYFNHTEDKGNYNNLTGVWDIGELNVGEVVNLTLIVRLDFPTAITFANITTAVNISSWSTDLYPNNNTDNITFEAEIFGNFRLLQDIVDGWLENTTQILPRSFAYDPVMDARLPGETYDLVNGVRLYKNVTIINPYGFTLGGFDMARIFNISANNVVLDGLRFYNGNSPLGGALNIHSNNVQVLRSNFSGNWLFGDYGGAIFTSGRNTLISDNLFWENYASKLGGAIGAVGAINLQILNNTFINNTVESDSVFGGAVGIANSTATVNNNVFLDNQAINAPNLGSAIYTDNSNVNLEANWFGNNTPNMTDNKLIWGVKPETYVILDWEIVNPNMTGVTLNAVFVLYNRSSGNKTSIGSGLPYRIVNITARDPILSGYNKTFTGNNTVNYTYNVAIPVYQVNATVDYQTITLEWSTFLDAYKSLVNDTVWFGDDLIYIINLTNYGPHNSYIITISDLLPENLTINSVTPTKGSTSIISDNVYWTLIINANKNETIIINTTPQHEGVYTNNLTVNSTNNYDYFLHGNTTVKGEVLPLFDLSINITMSNPPYYMWEEINYTITIHNKGPSNATDVLVYIPIPSGLKFLYTWNLDGYIPNYNNVTGLWNVSTLNAGETIQINMTLNLTQSGWYNQTVNITGYGVELNESDNNMTISFNVTTQVDLELNMTISTVETLYGKAVSITYYLLNKGPSPASNVTVFTVFSGLTYSSSSGYGSFNNITPFTGYWYVGNLNPNRIVTRTLHFYANTLETFTITGKANSSDNETYWPDNYANVTIKVIKYADISVTKTVSNSTPFLEQTISYTITVKNNAGFDAENVTVYDPLPSVLIYSGGNPDYNGTHWKVGNLTVGQTKTLTFNVTVDGIGIIWNNVTVNSSLNDSNLNNNHAEVSISVPVADDLRMYINVIPTNPSSSSSFIINLTVWNRGFTDNQNVTVEFHIPPGLIYINSTNMGAYNPTTGFWNIGFLGNGQRTNLEIWVYPSTVGNITLESNVSGQVADVAPWNNRANITFEIIPAFDLTITKTANTTLVDDGDLISFDITIWNNGPYQANNVKITDYLPQGTEYLFNNASGIYDNITHTVNWTIPTLYNGDNLTFHLILKVWNPGLSFTNTVTAEAYGSDSNITDNTATISVNVTPNNDLEIQINASKTTDIDLGDNILFYITVINHGPSNATNVIAHFDIPTIFTYITDNSGGNYTLSTGNWLIGNLESRTNTTLIITTNLTNMGICKANTTVNSTYIDKNLSNNYAEINLTATPFFDLNITAYWNLTNNTLIWQNLANLTIIVSNNGPENATNVTVQINIPGVSYINDTSLGKLNTTTWTWEVGNLTLGQYKNITITFKGETCGFHWTTGNITGHGHDTNTTNNNYTLNLTILPIVDLTMTNITVNTTYAGIDEILEFNITVYNKGPCNATNVTIVDLLPTGWYIYGGNIIADIPVNTSHTFNILVNASTHGNFTVGFNATINGIDTYPLDNNRTIGIIEIIYHTDLMITIKVSNKHPATGDIIVYVITVSNLDWRTAHNVTANITIPSNLSFDHYYLASGSYNPSNGTWNIGNLSFRNSTSLFLFTRVGTPGETSFWVNVTGDDYDFHLENNNDTCIINTTQGLDLNITITTLNSTPFTGDNVTFTVIVENIGLINATGVSVDINIPTGFINPTSTNLNFTGSSWYIGDLNIGEVKVLNFTVIPVVTSNLTVNVSVGASRYDYNMSNNFANITVSPLSAGDLEINITSNNSHPMLNENVTYTISILNKGMIDVNNVVIFNNLPYSLAYSTSTPIYSPSLKMWSITSLAPNTIQTLNITINHTTTGTFNYIANITGNLIDLNTTNNVANITTVVDDYNDLYIEFTVFNTTILDNNLLNFTITVYNNGSFNNTDVTVYTNLPNTDSYNCTGIFDTNLGIWNVGNLTSGENKTLTLLINMTNVGNYTYWANATGKQKDRNYSNNNQSLNLTILADYDIQINITILNTSIPNVGENITFTIVVYNYGPSTAHNVTILHDLLGTISTISIGNLTTNETKYYNITITPTSKGTYTYNVEIIADNLIYDRNTTNNKDNITITVVNTVDLIIKINSNVTNASKFDIAEITVTVYNNASNNAHNVLINTTGLFDSNIISSIVSSGFITGTDTWFISTIPGYGNATLNITKILINKTTVFVNVTSSDLELDNNTNNASLFINVTGLSDLKVNITVNNNTPAIGDNITFTITVYNLGEDTAEDVKVCLDLPYSTDYSDVYLYDSLQGIWNVGTLPNGTNQTLNVTITLTSTGIITYNAFVNASTPDNYTTNNYDNVTLNITSLTDLEVKIDTNITGDVLYAGDNITFTITVYNYGPSTATDVNITYNLPGTVSFYTMGSIIYPGLWNIPNLNPNTNTSLNLTYTLNMGDDGTYSANATGLEKERNTTNNNATINISLNKTADLKITINSNTTILDIGEYVLYTIIVTNNGPDSITSANVSFDIPSDFNITFNMSSNGILDGNNWILGSLGTGGSGVATLYIEGYYTNSGNKTINTIINSTITDRNLTNNKDNNTIYVVPACDLTLNFTSAGFFNPDGTMTFNITVTNYGPANATNITVHTNLPETDDYNATVGYFDTLQDIWYIDSLNVGETQTLIINTTLKNTTLFYANITSPIKESNVSKNIKWLNITTPQLADLSINITMNNTSPVLGESVMFTVTVSNLGPYTASGVMVLVDLPASPVYSVSKGLFSTVTGNWSIGNLTIGENATLNITLNITSMGTFVYHVNVTGATNDTNTSNNNDTINFTVAPTTDLSINLTINQTSFTVGDNVTFTINIYNNGLSNATDANVTINLPVGFIADPFTPPVGTYSGSVWSVGNFTNNTSYELNITGILTINGTQNCNVNITSETYDNDTTNNYAELNFNVENLVDLEIHISTNATSMLAGEFVNVYINVTNHGQGDAKNVLVSSNIFNATSLKDDGFYDKETGYWYIGTLDANTTVYLNLTLRITENKTFDVSVNTPNFDNNTFDNNDSTNIVVSPLVDLELTVAISDNNLYLEDSLTYTITIINKGFSTAENVNLTTNLTNSSDFIFLYSNDTNYNENIGIWTIGNLNPNEIITLKVKYQINTSGNITHSFYVNTSTYELDLSNNIEIVVIFVNNSTKPITDLVDLIVNITVNNSTPNLHDIITFNITVYNNASITATNVTLESFLPSGLTPIGSYTGNWSVGSLGAYANVSFTFDVNVTSYGSFVSNVTANSANWDANPTDNRANVLVVLGGNSTDYVDLQINITRYGNLTVGENITYNITVTNKGPSDATNVETLISLFTGLNVLNYTGNGTYNITDCVWTIGNITNGDSVNLEIIVNITDYGYYNNAFLVYCSDMDANPQNNLILDNFQVNDTRVDISVRITANKTFVGKNESVQFTVIVINHLDNVTDVNVTLTIPNEFIITSFVGNDTNSSYYIGNFSGGSVFNFTFTAILNSSNASTILVNVTLNETDSYYNDNIDSITISPLGADANGVADLHINITVNEQYPEIETVPIFNVWVTNYGPDDATNVEVPIYIPTDCISTSADTYWDNSTSTFRLANLSVGNTVKFEVSFRINTTNPILFNASVKSDQFDPNITDNKASISLYPWEATPTCDLNITIVPIGSEFHANDTVKFNVTIRNFGNKTAYNVSVRNIIPLGLTLESISTTWAYTPTTDGWFMPNHTINTNKSFILTCRISNKGLYQTTMEVNTSTVDIDPTSNGAGVAIYAGEAEPDRRNVTTKTTGTVAVATLNGDKNWTFKGTLKMANTTSTPTQNFPGQKLYANITSDGGFELTVESVDVTGSNGVANFAVNSAQLMTGAHNYKVTIFYKGEKTDDTYYLPSVATSITRKVTVNP